MIFRLATSTSTTLDSALASAAAAAAATAVLVATKATAVTATDSNLAERTNSGHFVPGKIIAGGPSALAFDVFQDVGKEGIELSLQNKNQSRETAAASTGTDRRLRNKSFVSPMDKVGDNGDDHNTIDLGVLDPINTKDVRNLESLVDTDQDGPTITCDILCGSDRKEITDDSDIKSLVSYCEDNDCDCDGDDDYIDYRCPSQFNCWDTSKITNMSKAFYEQKDFNEPLRCWDVSKVTDMSRMFMEALTFNQDISDWDVSSVTDMESMFEFYYCGYSRDGRRAAKFNQDIGQWDVSSVTDMALLLSGQSYFNHSLQSWDVSSVTSMVALFSYATDFNQPIDAWDVSSVGDMRYMFSHASSFNQPVDVWDISSVTDMDRMFQSSSFNQCLSTWASKNALKITCARNMFFQSDCPAGENSPDSNIGPWCQDSSNQCFEATCVDDPNFQFQSKESNNCEWVASGELSEKRCANDGVSEACSKTCNPTCRGIVCVDDPDFRLGGVKAKNCEWVAKQKTEERCKKPGVLEACPVTCDQSCAIAEGDCTDDSDFRLNGIKGKSCEWVAKQKTDKRCEKPGVMDSCRRTCNPSCGCRDSTDKFVFQGSIITCEDLDVIYCDADTEDNFKGSDDDFFVKLEVALAKRLDTIEDAVVEEETMAPTFFRDLCPNKCKKCIHS